MIKRFVFIILAGFVIYSCHPVRRIIRKPIREEGAEYLFSKLKKNEFKYTMLSAKFSAKVESDKSKNSFGGQIRMLKDSIIWISISPALGIEIFRLLLHNDSVFMLNRLDGTYLAGDYARLNQMFNTSLDFDMLQSFLTGNDFSYYENDKFKASVDNNIYKLSTLGRSKIKKYLKHEGDGDRVLLQDIWLDPENFKIQHVFVKDIEDNKKLDFYYSDFQLNSESMFPHKMAFELSAEKTTKVSLDFSKVTVDKKLNYPFSIPAKYKPIKLQSDQP